MEGLFSIISWACDGIHTKPIGLLNVKGYFYGLLKFLDHCVSQNFMEGAQRTLFISSFFDAELLDRLESAIAFPGAHANYEAQVNSGEVDLTLHLAEWNSNNVVSSIPLQNEEITSIAPSTNHLAHDSIGGSQSPLPIAETQGIEPPKQREEERNEDERMVIVPGDFSVNKTVREEVKRINKRLFDGKATRFLGLQNARDIYWEQLEQRFRWAPEHHSKVWKKYFGLVESAYRRKMNRIRTNIIKKSIPDFKPEEDYSRLIPFRPEEIGEQNWRNLCAVWNTPEWKKKSRAGSTNQRGIVLEEIISSLFFLLFCYNISLEHKMRAENVKAIQLGSTPTYGVAQDQIRLRAFPFSLADKAKDWLYYMPAGLLPTERGNVDAASGGALVNKTPEQARELFNLIAQNTQQFGTRETLVKKVNEIGNSFIENNLTELTNAISQLTTVGGVKGKPCGVCCLEGHPTDACPTLQHPEVNAVFLILTMRDGETTQISGKLIDGDVTARSSLGTKTKSQLYRKFLLNLVVHVALMSYCYKCVQIRRQEDYCKILCAKKGEDRGTWPVFDKDAWIQASGGVQKGDQWIGVPLQFSDPVAFHPARETPKDLDVTHRPLQQSRLEVPFASSSRRRCYVPIYPFPLPIMDRKPCNSQEVEIRKGPWTMEEDLILINYISNHGEGVWNSLARSAGLKRTGKSCRLRWLNYLRPDVRRGNITPEEQLLIMELHAKWGNR
ncbi:unnamed protein product [Cuscuta campestris]|uniref:Uncharacterized protein n=2 Tax=Cuscuta sect. Cleistogrammica TaxID=1824901 RepID=A0A484KZL4_9ASTE|nr:unnamed protein product [Cuscuta campestris]